MLLAMRLLQGIAAGAATVVAPTVIRATLADRDGVRGMAAIAMIEAIVPAAGPVVGTLLLLVLDWRGTFWVVAALAVLALPLALRATPVALPGADAAVATGYRALLRSPRYVRIALSHALCFGALLTFVASGPQMLRDALGAGGGAFALAQVCSVGAFIVVASQSGRISARIGAAHAVQWGALAQAGLCVGLLVACGFGAPPFGLVLGFWIAFCATLAVRGPAAFAEALAVPPAQMGRASAAMVLAVLAAGALGTQASALFLDGAGVLAVAATMAALCVASVLLVLPYPRPEPASA